MKGSMDRVHRGGPWNWGPCFVYVRAFHRAEYHRARQATRSRNFCENDTTPTTMLSSSPTTILCFRNSEWLRQDLLPRISPQRD